MADIRSRRRRRALFPTQRDQQVERQHLHVVWTYRTGDISDGSKYPRKSTFETTPILFGKILYLSTPFNRVIALDAESGAERWTFDPKIDRMVNYNEAFASRGVSAWADPAARPDAPCAR